jgi:hypothetical protein
MEVLPSRGWHDGAPLSAARLIAHRPLALAVTRLPGDLRATLPGSSGMCQHPIQWHLGRPIHRTAFPRSCTSSCPRAVAAACGSFSSTRSASRSSRSACAPVRCCLPHACSPPTSASPAVLSSRHTGISPQTATSRPAAADGRVSVLTRQRNRTAGRTRCRPTNSSSSSAGGARPARACPQTARRAARTRTLPAPRVASPLPGRPRRAPLSRARLPRHPRSRAAAPRAGRLPRPGTRSGRHARPDHRLRGLHPGVDAAMPRAAPLGSTPCSRRGALTGSSRVPDPGVDVAVPERAPRTHGGSPRSHSGRPGLFDDHVVAGVWRLPSCCR